MLIHAPLFPLFGMIWLSWGHSRIFIGPCCCDGMPCWVLLTESFGNWVWHNNECGYSLLLWLIKWLPIHFLELGKTRRAVPPFCFSHYYMRFVVSGMLGSLLLPTLFLVFLWSIFRWKVLTGPPSIPCLWLIYTCYVVEPHDLTGTTYAHWLRVGCPFSLKYLRPSQCLHSKCLYFIGFICSVMWRNFF